MTLHLLLPFFSAIATFLLLFSFEVSARDEICTRRLCNEKVKYWLASTKNSKGQWIAETGLEHPKKSGSLGWKLQVDNEATNCDGEEYCRWVATISAICPEDRTESNGYKTYSTGQYKLHLYNETSAIWSSAKRICENEGGFLAIINTQEEFEVLKGIVRENSKMVRCPWIGVIENNGVYVDVNGNYVKSFWAKGFPKKKNDGCGCISKDGIVDNEDCFERGSFLCEKS